jgi:hypothetical protein
MGFIHLVLELRWVIVGGIIILYLSRKVQAYIRLRNFDGPVSCRFSNFLHTKAVLSLQCETWYEEMTDKYGGYLVRGKTCVRV